MSRFSKRLPNFFLGRTDANLRISTFMSSKYVLLSDAMGRPDTKAIWYSFKHIEDLYKELVYLNADGLRIYMGEYKNDHPNFPGQSCLVMVPTRSSDTTDGHVDVILEDDADFADRPGRDYFFGREPSKSYNYGSPCPPVCPVEDDLKYPFTD